MLRILHGSASLFMNLYYQFKYISIFMCIRLSSVHSTAARRSGYAKSLHSYPIQPLCEASHKKVMVTLHHAALIITLCKLCSIECVYNTLYMQYNNN